MKNMATIEMKSVANHNVINLSTPTTLLNRLSAAILESRLAGLLASLFSLMLCEKVNPARTLRLLNAFTSGLCAFLFGGFSFLVQVLLLVWFGVAIWQCRRA